MEITRKVVLTLEQLISLRMMLRSELTSTLALGFKSIVARDDVKDPLSSLVTYAVTQMDIYRELDRVLDSGMEPYRNMPEEKLDITEGIALFLPTSQHEALEKIARDGAWYKALNQIKDVPAASVGAVLLRNKPGILLAFGEQHDFLFDMQAPKGVVQ